MCTLMCVPICLSACAYIYLPRRVGEVTGQEWQSLSMSSSQVDRAWDT